MAVGDKCPPVPDFENGQTVYLQSREVYSYLTHSCDIGYQLVGSVMRRCQLNKTWSGSTPTCIGNQRCMNEGEGVGVVGFCGWNHLLPLIFRYDLNIDC